MSRKQSGESYGLKIKTQGHHLRDGSRIHGADQTSEEKNMEASGLREKFQGTPSDKRLAKQ